MAATPFEIGIDHITPDLRRVDSIDSIDGLGRLILAQGLMEPIRIWFDGTRFRIIDGEKRWRACKKVGMKRVRVMIVSPPFSPTPG